MKNNVLLKLTFALCLMMNYNFIYAHCDTEDGPVVADAKKSIELNNINYALKWIPADREKELKEIFNKVMKVRVYNSDARELADHYFFETLVRIHRSSEGVPFSGLKPKGTPIDEKIQAADKSLVSGDISPLKKLVPENNFNELKLRFENAMALKNYDVNNVPAGRQFVAAYVSYFHYAEGEQENSHEHHPKSNHSTHIPWILSGLLFLSTLWFGFLYMKRK